MSAGRLELFELRRLLHQVTVTDSNCWEWRTLDHKGYGKVKHDGKTGGAHRYVWALVYGTPPDSLQLDHLCRNKACCNPDHLELVTAKENIRRKLIALDVFWCAKHKRYKARTRAGKLLCHPCRAEQARGYRANAAVLGDPA